MAQKFITTIGNTIDLNSVTQDQLAAYPEPNSTCPFEDEVTVTFKDIVEVKWNYGAKNGVYLAFRFNEIDTPLAFKSLVKTDSGFWIDENSDISEAETLITNTEGLAALMKNKGTLTKENLQTWVNWLKEQPRTLRVRAYKNNFIKHIINVI